METLNATSVLSYKRRLDRNVGWALNEGGKFFEDRSEVHKTLNRITARLNDIGVPYVVVGGMALYLHGFRRFTEDVDILVTSEGLAQIHSKLDGLGYVRPFEKSKNLRDAENGVKIEFLISGQFPGDGLPKPVAFPDPANVYVEAEGIRYLNLPTIIELKLASGMTNVGRMKDLADVQELIRTLTLPEDLANQLNPYVQAKYREIWHVTKPEEAE